MAELCTKREKSVVCVHLEPCAAAFPYMPAGGMKT